jgi:membrane protein YqaA with SNARE-associated domain
MTAFATALRQVAVAVLMTVTALMLVIIASDEGATSTTFAAMLGAVVGSMVVFVIAEFISNREATEAEKVEARLLEWLRYGERSEPSE